MSGARPPTGRGPAGQHARARQDTRVRAVRQGGTVATLTSFNLASMSGKEVTFELPADVIAAQAAKLA
ncbi:hypothetical protein [Streptomyces sp. NPDC048560]|uniref:hypothetical protein n=1 Tax=Streptomyces sp. NPDC048560 TaxID=3155488 RepID=UPI00341B7D07